MRVLVVEDEATTRLVVKRELLRLGYEAETAANGTEGWAKVCELPFPIVLTDLEMPGENGLELCRRIRSAPFPHYTYVVLLTHHSDRESLLSAFSSGADDFLGKSLDTEQLRVRLIVAQRIITLEKELRQTNARLVERNVGLEKLSLVDALTGAGNRAAFQEQIERTHSNALRSRKPYALVVCDLDRFKQINDGLGHRAGDKALCSVVTAIRRGLRTSDVVFRYGGDEMVLVVPDERSRGAAKLAERIRGEIEGEAMKDEAGHEFGLTASIGVASYPASSGEGADWAEVFALADEAMYAAKRRGGNGVVVADDHEGVEAVTAAAPGALAAV